MSNPELKQLTRAEQLADAGKLDKALGILNDKRQFEGLSPQQKSHFQFLKGFILFYQAKAEELIKFGEELFREGQDFSNKLQSFDGLFFNAYGLILAYRLEEAVGKIEQAENLLKNISSISQKDFILRKTRINILKGLCNLEIGNIDLAEKYSGETVGLEKELGKTFEIVWANIIMARVMFQGRYKFDLATKYTKNAMSIAKEIRFNHFWIAFCELSLGVINMSIGELDIGLKFHMKSLAMFKEIKNNYFIATTLNNIGAIYFEIGDYDLSLKYYEESLIYLEPGIEILPLSNLVEVALEKSDIELAQKYFNQLENLYNKKKDEIIVLAYQASKALMLSRSSRIRDKAKAEELLKQVVETETIWFDITTCSLVDLCDLLFSEYRLIYNNDVLDELNHYTAKLLTIAEKQHSYKLFCKTFILKAKLALINFDVKAARRFLTEAQKIAEKYGIKHLAMKISREHDELLRQTKTWENLREAEAPLSERLKQAGLNGDIRHMIRKQMFKVPELPDEDPILLLILSEGGIPIFSKIFTETLVLEEDLISSFLAAFNTFSAELFSEGLDRASFGDYTVLMKPISTFLVCYLFKGQSFTAHKRIQYFVEKIGKKKELLERLNEYYNTNQIVTLEDTPTLNSLMKKTFFKKNFV